MARNDCILGSLPANFLILVPILLVVAWGCRVEREPEVVAEKGASDAIAPPRFRITTDSAQQDSPIRFTTVTEEAGVDFDYYGGPTPEHFMTEQNGGGIALFDFDGDGQLDIFLSNGSNFTRPAESVGAAHRLYRATGPLRYIDVATAAGLHEFGFGMGCAAGDYDHDGFEDLFLAQYGRNRLWHNNGDGTFSEVTTAAGVIDDRWATSAAFADLDADGLLDLYVVNYVDWSPEDPPCFTQHQTPIQISCGPIGRSGQPDLLYQNAGDGTFRDVSGTAGIIRPEAKGLGLAIADFDADGWLDIYVANDTTENFMFRNRGGMRFEEVAVAQGVAVGSEGLAHSGMGVACGDVDGDGRFDLLVTNFDNEVNDLYRNLGGTGFLNVNQKFGLDPISRPMLGFGTLFSDFDADGHMDAFVANGHIWDLTQLQLHYAYAMTQQVLRNVQGHMFTDVSRSAGDYFQRPRLGRAVASGDLDGDGDDDLVVGHVESPVELVRNDSQPLRRVHRLRLIGKSSPRQPRGCRVDVSSGSHRDTYWIPSGGSFQSSSAADIVVLGDSSNHLQTITAHWPGQASETWQNVPAAPHITLIQGGAPVP